MPDLFAISSHSPLPVAGATTLALFCKVVDNYGDIGICWRLARQLQHEHAIAVTLWVDDLATFQRICPAVDVQAPAQSVQGVLVRHWRDQQQSFTPADIADIVIEFFGVDIPPGYIAAMAQRTPRAVWLNLEGMSAQSWVEGCHTLPSTHPRLPLVKHFFFPGFSEHTGGLLREAGLDSARRLFQADPDARAGFLSALGVRAEEQAATLVSLFCYPHAPVGALFDSWRSGGDAVTCLVPQGVASEAVAAFLGMAATVGAVRTEGALTVRVLPFLPQQEYDKLLWSCDFNFVRGEDSIVRAQWAARPFVWHIYPQDENLHHTKLRAFLARYLAGAEDEATEDINLRWNGALDDPEITSEPWHDSWRAFAAGAGAARERAELWQHAMAAHGDLAANLLHFVETVQAANRSVAP